jgi:hypothetical protein
MRVLYLTLTLHIHLLELIMHLVLLMRIGLCFYRIEGSAWAISH